MTTIQITVRGSDCYRLQGNGTVQKFEEKPSTRKWVALDNNVDNVQVIAANTVCVRRKNSEVYRHVGNSWNLIRRDTNKIWASENAYYAWDQSKRQVLRENAAQNGWDVIEENSLLKDLAVSGNNVYQLQTDGQVYIYEGGADGKKWRSVDHDMQADVITATGTTLYKRRRNGVICAWDATDWTVIGSDMRTVEFAAGDAGLFLRLNNGSIYRNHGPLSWEQADPSADNIQIAVGNFPYRVNAKGEVYRLPGNSSGWQILQDDPNNNPNNNANNNSESVTNNNTNIGNKNGRNPSNNNTNTNDTGPNNSNNPNTNAPQCKEPQPDQVYNGGYANNNSPILLRIGNGAAGQSGLIKVLGDAFIKDRVAKGDTPFRVGWYKSDTTETIAYLENGTIDVGITYNTAAEHIAMNNGIATKPSYYVFREHFLLVGPPSNPAKLDTDMTIDEMFSILYTAAEAGNTTPPVRFLSRFDKSATNIKDSELWIRIGQYMAYPIQALGAAAVLQEYTLTDWGTYLSGYHQYMAFPIQALGAAAALQEYTLTDWGTYLSVDESLRKQITIYKKGSESTYDPLLMPAHLLISSRAKNAGMAKKFADWLTSRTGQGVIEQFRKNSQQVYTPAPTI
ncbi:hypothetical protein MAJ_10227, partial [Metarhizium majus ARSEF 297]